MTPSHNSKPRCNPLENVRFITVLGILLIAVLGVFVLDMIGSKVSSYVAERNQKKRANWLVAEGGGPGNEGHQGSKGTLCWRMLSGVHRGGKAVHRLGCIRLPRSRSGLDGREDAGLPCLPLHGSLQPQRPIGCFRQETRRAAIGLPFQLAYHRHYTSHLPKVASREGIH